MPAFAVYATFAVSGERNSQFATVMDVLPTLLELAGAEPPGETYRDRPILPLKGRSMAATLRSHATPVHDASTYVGWELYDHRAIRQGDWKIVWDADEKPSARWRLFNLASDPQEQNDLSAAEPARLQAMIALWDDYHKENGLRP